jgi:Peptidase family M23
MRPITLICALAATLHFATADALASVGWTWPVRGPVLTPYRNGGNPYAGGQHRGIDIGALVGSRVVAAAGGTVTYAGIVGSSGLTVSERTADGRFQLSYLHLSSVAVHRGDVLAAGAPVGAVGVSGRRSVEAPHLHFGVREAGSRNAYLDPLDFLAPPAGDRAPRPVPAPARIPHPAGRRPVPAPARVRPRVVHAAPTPRTAPAPLPHGVPVVHPLRTPRPHRAPVPSRTPEPLRGPEAGPASAPPPAAPAPVHRGGSRSHEGGINVGWLLACLGLIAAATALGGPDATRKLATRGRVRLTALLRPASRGG